MLPRILFIIAVVWSFKVYIDILNGKKSLSGLMESVNKDLLECPTYTGSIACLMFHRRAVIHFLNSGIQR